MTDVRCAALLQRDDFDRASRYDAERAWRLVIALTDFDDGGVDAVLGECGDCPECLRGLVSALGGLLSGVLIGRHGRGNARRGAQAMLDEVLACPDILGGGE